MKVSILLYKVTKDYNFMISVLLTAAKGRIRHYQCFLSMINFENIYFLFAWNMVVLLLWLLVVPPPPFLSWTNDEQFVMSWPVPLKTKHLSNLWSLLFLNIGTFISSETKNLWSPGNFAPQKYLKLIKNNLNCKVYSTSGTNKHCIQEQLEPLKTTNQPTYRTKISMILGFKT